MIEFIFYGIIKLVAIIVLIFSIKVLKLLFLNAGKLIDVLLFVLSFWVLITGSVTVGISLMFTSLLFTLFRSFYMNNLDLFEKDKKERLNNFEHERDYKK